MLKILFLKNIRKVAFSVTLLLKNLKSPNVKSDSSF